MSKSKKERNKEDNVFLGFLGSNSVGVTGSCICGDYKNEQFLLELGGVQDGTQLENYRTNKSLIEKINFENINYIFINHFHIDHSMLIPCAIKNGFRGKIITNHKTAMMLRPLLEDSCHINEADVKFLRSTKGIKADPLYIMEHVNNTFDYICEYEENIEYKLSQNISFKLLRNNHVLGSTSLMMYFQAEGTPRKTLFYSSDMGNLSVDKYFVFDEVDKPESCNVAILESTYNDVNREAITKKMRKDDLRKLEEIILDTFLNKKGNLIMPCFSADRTQNILVHVKNIFDNHEELKDIQVILDGKLTSKVMKAYSKVLEGEQKELFDDISNWEQLKQISDYNTGTRMMLADPNPYLCISSSGMADKGHILEYIKSNIRHSKNTIVFSGFSSPSSLASRIKEKVRNPEKKNIVIEKVSYSFNCEVYELTSFSSHVQRRELIEMMKEMKVSNKIILVHGDLNGRRKLANDAMEEIMKENKTTRVVSAERNMTIEF
jgi:metallo-beta-lactamase family protein